MRFQNDGGLLILINIHIKNINLDNSSSQLVQKNKLYIPNSHREKAKELVITTGAYNYNNI